MANDPNPWLTLAGLSSTSRSDNASNAVGSGLTGYQDTYQSPLEMLLPRNTGTGIAMANASQVSEPNAWDPSRGGMSPAWSALADARLNQTPAASNSAPSPAFRDGSDDSAKAWQILNDAKAGYQTALNAPAPQYHAPQTSPLAAALLTFGAGYLNSQSPYSSEGTQMLGAYQQARKEQADTAHQNALQAYAQQLAAAKGQYEMGQTSANRLFQQSDAANEAQAAAEQLKAQQTFQQQMQQAGFTHADQAAAAQHQYDLQNLTTEHQNKLAEMAQQGQLGDRQAAFNQVLGSIMQNPKARSTMATETLLQHGYAPAEAQQMGQAVANQTPDELQAILKNDALREQIQSLKLDNADKPTMNKLDAALKRAQITAANANTAQTGAQTNMIGQQSKMLGQLTPVDKANLLGSTFNAANKDLVDATKALAQYKEKWQADHKYAALPGQPTPAIEDDPTYKDLANEVRVRRGRTDQLSQAVQGLFGPIGKPGNGSGFTRPVPVNIDNLPPGVTIERIGG